MTTVQQVCWWLQVNESVNDYSSMSLLNYSSTNLLMIAVQKSVDKYSSISLLMNTVQQVCWWLQLNESVKFY